MSFRRIAYFLCLAIVFLNGTVSCCPAIAQSSTVPRRVARSYSPGEVILEQSRVFIHVAKAGWGHEHAVAGLLRSGHIALDGKQNAGELVFEMAGFVADPEYARKFIGLEGISDPSTQQKVTANMLGPEVLDVAHYPTAAFRIDAARSTQTMSQRRLPIYDFAGEFTLHGTTRPIHFRAEVEQLDSRLRIMGSFTIQQSDFGITPFTKAFGVIGVADQLRIHGDLYVANKVDAATTVEHK